jgi:hypothetical protein
VKQCNSVEVIVGAVTGSLRRPGVLVVGRYRGKVLEVIGRTVKLKEAEAAAIAPLLKPAGARHPWPDEISTHWGRGSKTPMVKVQPKIAPRPPPHRPHRGRRRHLAHRLIHASGMRGAVPAAARLQSGAATDSGAASCTAPAGVAAVAIPLLAALLVLNRQEEFRRRASMSALVEVAKAVAQASSFVGMTAAFWRISMVAGIVFLVVGFFAVGVHSSG